MHHRIGIMSLVVVVLAVPALWVWWQSSVPGELVFSGIEVGRLSQFGARNVAFPERMAARIAFLSPDDYRKTMTEDRERDEPYYGLLEHGAPCDCVEEHFPGCDQSLGVYDSFGEIQWHIPAVPGHSSSRTTPSEQQTRYFVLVPLQQWANGDQPYDLVRKPEDICFQLERYEFWGPNRHSNTMRIPRQTIAAAIARAGLK